MNLLATGNAAMGWGTIILYVVVIGAFMYFAAIRPQKKEQKRLNAMLATMEVGDVVVKNIMGYDSDLIVTKQVGIK